MGKGVNNMDYCEIPYIIAGNGVINEVGDLFAQLTGYKKEHFINKSLSEFCDILRINSPSKLCSIDEEYYYLFTSSYEPVEVAISFQCENSNNQRIYCFIRKNIEIIDRFPYVNHVLSDNKTGLAIYSSPDFTLLKANQKFMDSLDEPYNKKKGCIGRPLREIVKGFEYSEIIKVWDNVLQEKESFYSEEIKCNNSVKGETYWNLSLVPVVIDEKIKYLVQRIDDITEKVKSRKIIEKQKEIIEEQNRRLQVIIDNISEGVCAADLDGRFILLNSEAKKYVYRSETISSLQDAYNDIIYADMESRRIPYDEMPLQRSLRGESVRNFKSAIKFPEKEIIIECNSSPIYDHDGNITMALSCTHDITELVQSKKIIEEQIEMLRHIIQDLDLPFIRLSYPELKILEINKRTYKIIKALDPSVKWINNEKEYNIKDIFPGVFTDDFHTRMNAAVKNGDICYYKNLRLDVNHEETYINMICQPVIGLNDVVELVIIIVDITSEVKKTKDMEKLLKQQEEFFANISHEFKTPLNIIYSTIQLFNIYLKGGSLDDKRQIFERYLKSITQNCCRLLKLINNIVDLSKIDAGFYELNLSNNNIVQVVEDIVMSAADYVQTRGLNLTFDTNVEERFIACDPEKIERMVLNLIANAVKFSDPGNDIYVNILDKGDYIEISVRDNGIGIDKTDLDMIFDRFAQVDKSLSRNAEGTGIGLSIVKSFTELHGGKVLVESEFGKGSRFTVTLPARCIENENNSCSRALISNDDVARIELSDIV